MGWIRAGTVTVTNGSPNVVGAATTWLTTVNPGDTFYGVDGRLYEVGTVTTDTAMALATPYQGITQAGAPYAVYPTQDAVRVAANRLSEVLQALQLNTMPAAGPTSGSDKLLINQAGVSRSITLTALLALTGTAGALNLPALAAAGIPLANADLMLVSQSGTNTKVTIEQLRAALGGIAGLTLEVDTGDAVVAANNFTIRPKTNNTNAIANQAPSGTATQSEQRLFAGSDVNNAPGLRLRSTATYNEIVSIGTGSAIIQELRLGAGSNVQVRMTSDGGLTFKAPASATLQNGEHSINPVAANRLRVSFRDGSGIERRRDIHLREDSELFYVSEDERFVMFIGGRGGEDMGLALQNASFFADLYEIPLVLPPWEVFTRRAFRCNKIIGIRGKSFITPQAPFDASATFANEFTIVNRRFSQAFDDATADDCYYLDFGMRIGLPQGMGGIGLGNVKSFKFTGLYLKAVATVFGGKTQPVNSLVDLYSTCRNGVIYDNDFINATGAYGAGTRIQPDGGGCLWVRNFRGSALSLATLQSTAPADRALVEAEAELWATENIEVHGNRFVHMTSDEVYAVYGVCGIVRRVNTHDNVFIGPPSIDRVHYASFVSIFPLKFFSSGAVPLFDALGKTAGVYDNRFHSNTVICHAAVYDVLRIGLSSDPQNKCYDNKSYNNRVLWIRSTDPVTGPKAAWVEAGSPGGSALDPDILSTVIKCVDGQFGFAYFSDTSGNTSSEDTAIAVGPVNFGFTGFQRISNPETLGNVFHGIGTTRFVFGGKIEAGGYCFFNVRFVAGCNYRQNVPGGAVFYVNDAQGGTYSLINTSGESFGSLVQVDGGQPVNTLVNCFGNGVQFSGGASAVAILRNMSAGGSFGGRIIARGNTSLGVSASVTSGAGLIDNEGNNWNGVVDGPPPVRLAGGNTFTGAQTVAYVGLVDTDDIVTDAALSNNFSVTMAASRNLLNPTNLRDGGQYTWRFKQGPGGPHNFLTIGTMFKFPGGVVPTLSTALGAVDHWRGRFNAADNVVECEAIKDFR
ncbi:hypothetical protein UFOVP703_52 [uncultured Caudovirales phage]|uniref:Tail fiber protein n=1 Tax=uncultured Caudovirales phage TaxID=2100421 RepID=A0A6J5NMU1_9CAUD|nr:hypothetical protein UFOVP703_52 [uncultured Caudovirales phage]